VRTPAEQPTRSVHAESEAEEARQEVDALFDRPVTAGFMPVFVKYIIPLLGGVPAQAGGVVGLSFTG